MTEFTVDWTININASTAEEAARQAFDIMSKPDTTATVFNVIDESGDAKSVDLLEEEQNETPPSPKMGTYERK